MKAILEFNLDDPDDAMAHLRCAKSLDMALLIWNICNSQDLVFTNINDKTLKMIKEQIYEAMLNKGIIIDDLVN